MTLLSTEVVIAHLREDPDADVSLYLNGAIDIASQYLNRSIFESAEALAGARVAAVGVMAEASQDYQAALAAAQVIADPEAKAMALAAASEALRDARLKATMDVHGVVATDGIRDALLLTVGHLWANRESVLTGTRAAAVEIPMGTMDLLRPYRRVMM